MFTVPYDVILLYLRKYIYLQYKQYLHKYIVNNVYLRKYINGVYLSHQQGGEQVPTTKASQKAVNKYISAKYDRVNLVMSKGKKEEYRSAAEASGKSLNQFVIDCIEKALE